MASKVKRDINSSNIFKMREFSTVERGEHKYDMRAFADDEELSVQDLFSDTGEDEPETIIEYVDEVTDKDYLPPSRLQKAEDGLIGEKVEFPTGSFGGGFIESDAFSDSFFHDTPTQPIIRSLNNHDELPPEDLPFDTAPTNDNVVQMVPNSEESFQQIEAFSPLISEEELEELKNELANYKEKYENALAEIEDIKGLKNTIERALQQRDKELDDLKVLYDGVSVGLPQKLEQAKKEGDEAGYLRGKSDFEKKYEVEKQDYMSKLEGFYSSANAKLEEISSSINAFDQEVPETVIGFLKTIIGVERKINDEFAALVIKNSLDLLKDYKDIRFEVNPVNEEATKAAFPSYKVTSNIDIPQGGVIVHSSSGNLILDVNEMIADLESQINEKLTLSQNDNSKE